jgi:hypothetical protein
MLPYRLRLPKGKDKSTVLDSTDSGGPIQRALSSDLFALFDEYKLELRAQYHRNDVCDINARTGGAFSVLKKIFGSTKASLLHSRLAPKRCDRAAFSQLIYASCWRMLQQSFDDGASNRTVDLLLASHAIFCLYILHETNPLPHGHASSESDILTMLPMGVNQNLETPGYMYRRHFKHPIRLDMQQLNNLQRLQQIALATTASCRISSASSPWLQMDYAVATDLLHVIQRLVPSLLCCSYTGPCSLEGLAGHESYALSTGDAFIQFVDQSSSIGLTDTAREFVSDDVTKKLETYLEACRAIRLPVGTDKVSQIRTGRIRRSLDPIFGLPSTADDPLTLLRHKHTPEDASGHKHVKLQRNVTFEVNGAHHVKANEVDASGLIVNASTASPHGTTCNIVPDSAADLDGVFYALVLPNDLSARQQESLQEAMETLLSRDKHLLFPSIEATSGAIDDLSKLAPDGTSTSMVSRTGQNALNDLLRKAAGSQEVLSDLDERSELMKYRKSVDHGDEMSDISHDNDDDLSVAASAIGCNAFRDLLKKSSRTTATRKGRLETSSGNGDKKRKAHAVNRSVDDHAVDVNAAVRKSVSKPGQQIESSDHLHEDSSSCSDGKSPHATNGDQQGWSALTELLTMANKK